MMNQILRFLAEANFSDFIHNRTFLGLTAAVIVLSILRKSTFLPVAYFGLIALGVIVGRTLPPASAEGPAEINMQIMIFSLGVLAVVAGAVYMLLIKSD